MTIEQKLAVVIYGGAFADWETTFAQQIAHGKLPHRLIFVVGAGQNLPASTVGLAQRAFERVFSLPTKHFGPKGFTQAAVYEAASRILEDPKIAHVGPVLWLGRPIDIIRPTWLQEVENEYRMVQGPPGTTTHLWMGSLFQVSISGKPEQIPISAFVAPPNWAKHVDAMAFTRLGSKPQSEEPVTLNLRYEISRRWKNTTLFGASDVGQDGRWAFAVRKMGHQGGPIRANDGNGVVRYDLQALLSWLQFQGPLGLDDSILSRTVVDALKTGQISIFSKMDLPDPREDVQVLPIPQSQILPEVTTPKPEPPPQMPLQNQAFIKEDVFHQERLNATLPAPASSLIGLTHEQINAELIRRSEDLAKEHRLPKEAVAKFFGTPTQNGVPIPDFSNVETDEPASEPWQLPVGVEQPPKVSLPKKGPGRPKKYATT